MEASAAYFDMLRPSLANRPNIFKKYTVKVRAHTREIKVNKVVVKAERGQGPAFFAALIAAMERLHALHPPLAERITVLCLPEKADVQQA